jgi:putative N6-adenine-specific DNA methylase
MAARRSRQAPARGGRRLDWAMPVGPRYACFAITPPGLEALTAAELARLGVGAPVVEPGGVGFEADSAGLYAANLELRTASRIVVRLAGFPARAFYELERKAKRVPWGDIVAPGSPVRFRVTARKSRLYHEEGIAERLHSAMGGGGPAPAAEVEPESEAEETETPPGQLFLVRVVRDQVTISADSSGELLHRRGYRLATARAPLRETLAAALLLGAGYAGGVALADPFCGSGTIPIEAARLARRIAPGLGRRFAFEQWPGFDAAGWKALVASALERILPRAGAAIVGSDRDPGAIAAARANAVRAGVADDIRFEEAALSEARPPAAAGLLASNPPYGVRIGARRELRDLYARLGALLSERWSGWEVALLSADAGLLAATGLPFTVAWESQNGGLPVRLVRRS